MQHFLNIFICFVLNVLDYGIIFCTTIDHKGRIIFWLRVSHILALSLNFVTQASPAISFPQNFLGHLH